MEKAMIILSAVSACLGPYGEAIHLMLQPEIQYPPCFFNPLCTCSKVFPDLGRVMCKDIPLNSIPMHINQSKVYMIHMENNGLTSLEPHFLQHTGLYGIEISRNSLTEVPENTFAGLEKSLWELDLHCNHLQKVPNRALRNLQRLKFLNLSGNEITFISSEDWKGMESSLEIISLKENGIIALQPSSFASVKNLQELDLSSNSIFDIDGNVFKDGPFRLAKLNLADNMLSKIPYHQLDNLRFLRELDLSFNHVKDIQDSMFYYEVSKRILLNLDILRLDYNQIQFLPTGSFKYFATLNRTYLNGNPISKIQENAFRETKIRELFLRDCLISEVDRETFSGLEHSLWELDLSGNNLTRLPEKAFKGLESLQRLFLGENSLERLTVDAFHDSLQVLDLRGRGNALVDFRLLNKFQSIHSLSLSRTLISTLSEEDFFGFSTNLEELRISNWNLRTIKNHAFRNVRRLKRLDLSENSISSIESDAFAEVGHFLQYLCMSNAFSHTLSHLSSDIFVHLTALQHFDASNNHLRYFNGTSFHSMKQLRILELQDNQIEMIPKDTFLVNVHTELQIIHLSFNRLISIFEKTFADLESLEILRMDDNQIRKLEERAFFNLDKLRHLNLRGNKIDFISHRAFENLPILEYLDLAFNTLTDFNYFFFDQVGVLSSLTLNVSHNSISRLVINNSLPSLEVTRVNIKVMDFSHNNISYISKSYFEQIESSVTHLYLSNNALRNITRDVLYNVIHLQWLDLSKNFLNSLDSDILRSCRKLQVMKMSGNQLSNIPDNIFDGLEYLRVIELANNYLKSLPEALFRVKTVERLDLSDNHLMRVPVSSFKDDAAASVIEMYLSNNLIMSLHSADMFRSFRNLRVLDLSGNPLIRIEDGAFSQLPQLQSLDLSHNPDISVALNGRTVFGLENTLINLYLRNLSLEEVPEFHLPHLKILDLSHNKVRTLPIELSQNLPNLRKLELYGNRLPEIPLAIHSLTQLHYLGVSGNEIDSINFHRGSRLRELDIRNMHITPLGLNGLDHLQYLHTLRLSLPRQTSNFNLPRLLQDNPAIQHIYLESFEDASPFGEEMKGLFSPKLRIITLSGKGFKVLTDKALQGIASPRLNLLVFNTSVEEIPGTVFQNAKHIRNLTIDLRFNELRSVGNPNSGRQPNMPGKSFLLILKMADNKWSCDCELGWIEGWDRIRRRYLCPDPTASCRGVDDDLRTSTCLNKVGKSVLEVLKTEIECGWNLSWSTRSSLMLIMSLPLILMWRAATI